MNIVKIKDILMPETASVAEFFNTKLKGKYAYWVQMRYIFPLNDLDYTTYINYEQYDEVHFLGPNVPEHIDLYTEECCMLDFARVFIDVAETERINRIDEYYVANEYCTDSDIDIHRLRNFRSWLARELLKLNMGINGSLLEKFDENQAHMLEYYKNDMYDYVVKQLSVFGVNNSQVVSTKTNTCGCSSNISSLYNIGAVSSCNALDVYKGNLHKLMVSTFEDANFWLQFDVDFLKTVKKYIDNIIKTGLVINTNDRTTVLVDGCQCKTNDNSLTESMLKKLSEAFGYIIDGSVMGHSNFIHDALYNWAEYLYDYMSWKIEKH